MAQPVPNDQTVPQGAIPVRLVAANGNSFYTAGGGVSPAPYQPTALGYQQIVGATLVAATALTVPATATFAVIEAELADIRWRDDGVSPTASVGMLLYAGTAPTFGGDLATLQFIGTQTTSVLNVSYYK